MGGITSELAKKSAELLRRVSEGSLDDFRQDNIAGLHGRPSEMSKKIWRAKLKPFLPPHLWYSHDKSTNKIGGAVCKDRYISVPSAWEM